jgi:CheY-like chemotaxis protein
LLTALLESEGWRVTACSDAREALTHFEVAPFDLVVSDQIMPGMLGTELVEKVRVLRPNVRCIFVSGAHAPSEAEGIPWFNKPLDIDAFLAMVADRTM